MSLQAELEAYKEKFLQKADQNKIEAFEGGIQEVIQSGILKQALNTGDQAISFTLKNAKGQEVSLDNYLEKGPVVLTWYRGGWCPYCNLSLKHLQQYLPQFKKEGANLLALTPELPDKSLSTQEKNELEFEVLSDVNNTVARQYGLVFQLNDTVSGYYKQAFDLEVYNGNNSDELPLAATYVIDSSGKIRYAFLDADYRNRAEPEEVLKQLKQLS
ncbi:peroxiredoxin-like family protein [Porifericola rhodea]|uniref:peroxiredoxin-like family protein n=1 Tax=Porifericola rhodea TaxID=930972 RepID=UPI00266671A1|nr:peroxiredoxin-like family protein [Porifericola rhodea]WKN32825.1 peroxiredoxin-like family protein [Porifericola rhodea]